MPDIKIILDAHRK